MNIIHENVIQYERNVSLKLKPDCTIIFKLSV